MIDSLAAALTIASLLTALAVLTAVATGGYRWRSVLPVSAVVEVSVVLQAALALVALVRGHHPGEPTVFLAYLTVSVLLLPVTLAQVWRHDDRWSGVLVSTGFTVLAVVVVRAAATWRS